MHTLSQVWNPPEFSQGLHGSVGRMPAAEAARRAMLEAACPSHFIFNTRDAASAYEVKRIFALQELLIAIDRLSTHKRDWFEVRRRGGGELLVISTPGRRLLESLAVLTHDAVIGDFQRRIEPRLQLALTCAASSLPLSSDPVAFISHLEQNPQGSVIILSGLVSQIREGLTKRSMDDRVRRHRARDESFLRDIKTYFKDIAATYPDAIVLRHELRRAGGASSFYPIQMARESHRLMSDWLEAMKRRHGNAIVGHAWRMQSDTFVGVHHHVLLILNGPTSNQLPELFGSGRSAWLEMTGPGGHVLDCKSARVDLMFRGRVAYRGDTLLQELYDAAVYFSCTDGLIAQDFDGQPPQRGFKSRPKALRAAQTFTSI